MKNRDMTREASHLHMDMTRVNLKVMSREVNPRVNLKVMSREVRIQFISKEDRQERSPQQQW